MPFSIHGKKNDEDKLESIITSIKTMQDYWYDEAKKNKNNEYLVYKIEMYAKALAAKSILDAIDKIK